MVADTETLQAERAGQRFSEWLEGAPIKRTAARELLQGLGIKPDTIRVPGISAAVAWLSPEQVAAMDAAAARVAAGESVAAVCSGSAADEGLAAPATSRDRSRPDADTMMRVMGALLQAQGAGVVPSPLTRARALREAAVEGLRLTAEELAEITGRPAAGIARLRSGSRLQGYRVWRVGGSAADPEPVYVLTETAGLRAPGDPRRAPGRDESRPDAD